jgi:hypothetical protein
MRTMIETHGGKLITMQAPVAKDEGRYRQYNDQPAAERNHLRAAPHPARDRDEPAVLFVDNLQVRSQVPANFRPAPGNEPEMYIQMDVTGYALVGGG